MKGSRRIAALALVVLGCVAPMLVAAPAAASEAPNRVLTRAIMRDGVRHGTLIVKEYDHCVVFINTASKRNYGKPTRRALVVIDETSDQVWPVDRVREYYVKLRVCVPDNHSFTVAALTDTNGAKKPDRFARVKLTFTMR